MRITRHILHAENTAMFTQKRIFFISICSNGQFQTQRCSFLLHSCNKIRDYTSIILVYFYALRFEQFLNNQLLRFFPPGIFWVKQPIRQTGKQQHRPGWPERSMFAQSRLLAMRTLSFRESALLSQSGGTAEEEKEDESFREHRSFPVLRYCTLKGTQNNWMDHVSLFYSTIIEAITYFWHGNISLFLQRSGSFMLIWLPLTNHHVTLCSLQYNQELVYWHFTRKRHQAGASQSCAIIYWNTQTEAGTCKWFWGGGSLFCFTPVFTPHLVSARIISSYNS